MAQVPCRVSVFLARDAETAVILRRGPVRWVELIRWNTREDTFERGQWFHGRVYEERCDLSPDGLKFIYFASKYGRKRDADVADTWTAISKPPYFTALAMWANGSTWGGGGFFLDEKRVYVCEGAETHPRFPLKRLTQVSFNDLTASYRQSARFDRGAMRFQRNGWEIIEIVRERPVKWRKKAGVGPRELIMDRSLPTPAFYLVGVGEDLQAFQWADFDRCGRLVTVRDGKLLAENKEIADFNDDRPENREAPGWAQQW